MRRVLVTRPEPGAAGTARRLAQLGHEPVLLPLSQTQALPLAAGCFPQDVAAVAITSANAISHAPEDLISALAALPCHTVGEKTAKAAREAGFRDVHEGPGNAADLAGQLARELAGAKLAYLCGRLRFTLFEERLAEAGIRVHVLESYNTVALNHTGDAVMARLSNQQVDAVLLYSAMAAQAAGELMARPGLRPLFEGAELFALSGRIASALGEVADTRVHVAPRPDETALLALLG